MYHVPFALQYIYGRSDGSENWSGKEGREWRLLGLLYVDDLVLCGGLEEELRGRFSEVCRRSCLKVNAGMSKVMILNGG